MGEIADRSDALIEAFDRAFVGRDQELLSLDEHHARGGIVLITGGPGAGKSALLAHWIGKRRTAGETVAAHFFGEGRASLPCPARI